MPGIYIHIPFCKQACTYCNFHFSTSLKMKDDLLRALVEEIRMSKDTLNGEKVETIYVEEGTVLHHNISKKKVAPVDAAQSAGQFAILMERAAATGYEHYEISNLAL